MAKNTANLFIYFKQIEVYSKRMLFDYVFHLSKKTGETFLDTFIFQISFKPLFSILLGIQKYTMQCK